MGRPRGRPARRRRPLPRAAPRNDRRGAAVSPRRLAALGLAALALAALLVAVGRWERTRRADEQNSGMARVLAAIGPLDSPSLSAFRVLTAFQCLLYTR